MNPPGDKTSDFSFRVFLLEEGRRPIMRMMTARLLDDARIARRIGGICAVTLLALVSNAGADDVDRNIAEFIDTNGEKHISYDEFVHSAAVKALRELDANKDGLLNRAEAASSGVRQSAAIPSIGFSDADANGDGHLSLNELEQALRGHPGVTESFLKLDRNGDTMLSPSELKGIDGRSSLHAVPQVRIRVPF